MNKMGNEIVLLQMRKVGAEQNSSEGMKFADRQYQFLEWLQELYDCNCLKGNFYTNNIVQEVWDKIRRHSDPLQAIEDGFNQLNEQLKIAISGDAEALK